LESTRAPYRYESNFQQRHAGHNLAEAEEFALNATRQDNTYECYIPRCVVDSSHNGIGPFDGASCGYCHVPNQRTGHLGNKRRRDIRRTIRASDRW